MNQKPSPKNRPRNPAAKRSAGAGEARLLAPEFLQESPGEQETLLALERLLTRAQGFSLAFARVNMPVQRAELVQAIRRRLEPQGFTFLEIEFTVPIADLLAELSRRLPPETRDQKPQTGASVARRAIFVYGLENSISSSAVYHPLLAVINYKRENFRELIPWPLVLWVPEYVLQAIIEGAPDFWAWRSGVFEFAAPQAELEKMWGQFESERGAMVLARLTLAEKKQRTQLLANLLAEYEVHEKADTPEIMTIRADLLNRLGLLHDHLGNLDEALGYYEKSRSIRKKLGNRAGEGATLNNIGNIYRARGDYATALDYWQQSLKISREIGDRQGEGTTLNNISQIYKARGDYATALEYLEKSLAIQREIGDRQGEGRALGNIGNIYRARGDYDTALDYLQQSLKILREIGDRQGEGTTLGNIGNIYHARGDYATALDYLQQSLKISREIGDRQGEGATLNNISQIYDARGDYATALEYLEKSLKISREIGDRAGMIPTLHNLAHIYLQNQQLQAALETFGEALQLSFETNNAEGLFNVARDLGNVLCLIGQKKEGVKLLQQSLAVGRQMGHPDLPEVEELVRNYTAE
ncbi:MAG: tetratricopeptide repeat protein [candidate division KSB1 bacterium]|nr:tetratricopeptide repeat protein [candidate division KSB1 bacterium]MDZ7302371.1 tetratricopeptide repeat protein [candidate division KSB1 bacterium]MDZ7313974.1 tetratricopeptide repeat protein [candidate division KSB1 bacterium]